MYADLYKAWKAEKTTENPQELPGDFYKRAIGYLQGLEDDSAASDTRTIQGSLLVNEKEVAQRLLEELKQARLRKIVNAAREGGPVSTQGLTEEEKTLVERFNESLSSYKDREKSKQAVSTSEDLTELSIVRFLGDVPEIVGVDLRIYGPYKKEDVGSLPHQNAQALIKEGLAKLIDVKRVPHSLHEDVGQLQQQ